MVKLSSTLRRAIIKQNFTKIRRIVEAKQTSEVKYFHQLVNEVLRQFIKRHSQSIVIDPNIVHYLLWAGASPEPYIHTTLHRVSDSLSMLYMESPLGPYLGTWSLGKKDHVFESNRYFLSLFSYSSASLENWNHQFGTLRQKITDLTHQLEQLTTEQNRVKAELEETKPELARFISLINAGEEGAEEQESLLFAAKAELQFIYTKAESEWLLLDTKITEIQSLLREKLWKAECLWRRIKSMESHENGDKIYWKKLHLQHDFQDKVIHFLRFVLQFNEMGRVKLGLISKLRSLFDYLVDWYKKQENVAFIEQKLLEFSKVFCSIKNENLPNFSVDYLPFILEHSANLRWQRELDMKLRSNDQLVLGEVASREILLEQIDNFMEMSKNHAIVRFFDRALIPYISSTQLTFYLGKAMKYGYYNLAVCILPYIASADFEDLPILQPIPFAFRQALILTAPLAPTDIALISSEFIFTPPLLPTPPEMPANYWISRWQPLRQNWLSQVVGEREVYFFHSLCADPLLVFYDDGARRLRSYLNVAAQLSPRRLSQLGIDCLLGRMLGFAAFTSSTMVAGLPLDIQRQIALFLHGEIDKDNRALQNHARATIIFHSIHLVNIFAIRQHVHYADLEKIAIALIHVDSHVAGIRVSDRYFAQLLRRFLISHAVIHVSRDREKIAAFFAQKLRILAGLIDLGVSRERLLWEALQNLQQPIATFLIQQKANLFHSPTNQSFSRLVILLILHNQLPVDFLMEVIAALGVDDFVLWLTHPTQSQKPAFELIFEKMAHPLAAFLGNWLESSPRSQLVSDTLSSLLWEGVKVKNTELCRLFIREESREIGQQSFKYSAYYVIAAVLAEKIPIADLNHCSDCFPDPNSFLAWIDKKNEACCSGLDLIANTRNQALLGWLADFLQRAVSKESQFHEAWFKGMRITRSDYHHEGNTFWHILAHALGQKAISQATFDYCLLYEWHGLQDCLAQKNQKQETFFDILQLYNISFVRSLQRIVSKKSPSDFLQLAIRVGFPISEICNTLMQFSLQTIRSGKILLFAYEAAKHDKAYGAVIITLLKWGVPFTDGATFGHILQLALETENDDLLNLPVMSLFVDSDSQGNTALHLAVRTGDGKMGLYLVNKCHRLVNQANNEGHTPLHLAIHLRLLKPIVWLCQRGSDLSLKDQKGKTPAALLLDHFEELAEQIRKENAPARIIQTILLNAVEQRIGSAHNGYRYPCSWRRILESIDKKFWTMRFHQNAHHPFANHLQALGILAYLKNPKLREFLMEEDDKTASCSRLSFR